MTTTENTMSDHTIKKGYNIRITGEPDAFLEQGEFPRRVALKPADFRGITPVLLVKTGDRVTTGTPLFHDKSVPDVVFTSPAGGKVCEIRRGARRMIEAVVVETDGRETARLGVHRGKTSYRDRDDIVAALLATGLFPLLRRRPYAGIAVPGEIPRDIFISALNTAPLSPDPNVIVREREEYFQKGLDILARLTTGKVHLSVEKDRHDLSPAYTMARGVELHRFNPLHPAGNTGVQIHHISPVRGPEDIVWYATPQGVIHIGRFFSTGRLSFETVVAVTGEGAPRRTCLRTVTGASVESLTGPVDESEKLRFISGDILTGTAAGYGGFTGFYDNMITVLPEARGAEFLGWLSPGLKKESVSSTFLSRLLPGKNFSLSTNRNGGIRAFVATGVYEKVLPMNIYPLFLLKSILAEDIEEMEKLGICEVAEEDFALCEFVCPSKIGIQDIIRRGIELMVKEA